MKRSQFWAITWGWCAVVALALTLSQAVLGRPSQPPVLTSFAIAATYSLCIGLPTGVISWRLMSSQARSTLYRTLVGLVVPPVLCVPCSLVGVCVLAIAGLVPSEELWTRWQLDVRVALLISIAIGIASVMYGGLWARLETMQLELKTQELARERAEKLASEAQLASLAARLEPHFLFNTLNSIISLIRVDPPRAERILGRFAALLRSSLDAREGDLVPLSKETKLLEDYLEIQHARYAHRLRYEIDVPGTLLEHRVPPFSLQTLVENSVKYAVAPSPSGSMIRVVAAIEEGRLCLEVWDEGPGFSAEQIRPDHGIDNLRERLGCIYGGAARLAIGRERFRARGPELTRVAIELPFRGGAAA